MDKSTNNSSRYVLKVANDAVGNAVVNALRTHLNRGRYDIRVKGTLPNETVTGQERRCMQASGAIPLTVAKYHRVYLDDKLAQGEHYATYKSAFEAGQRSVPADADELNEYERLGTEIADRDDEIARLELRNDELFRELGERNEQFDRVTREFSQYRTWMNEKRVPELVGKAQGEPATFGAALLKMGATQPGEEKALAAALELISELKDMVSNPVSDTDEAIAMLQAKGFGVTYTDGRFIR